MPFGKLVCSPCPGAIRTPEAMENPVTSIDKRRAFWVEPNCVLVCPYSVHEMQASSAVSQRSPKNCAGQRQRQGTAIDEFVVETQLNSPPCAHGGPGSGTVTFAESAAPELLLLLLESSVAVSEPSLPVLLLLLCAAVSGSIIISIMHNVTAMRRLPQHRCELSFIGG